MILFSSQIDENEILYLIAVNNKNPSDLTILLLKIDNVFSKFFAINLRVTEFDSQYAALASVLSVVKELTKTF